MEPQEERNAPDVLSASKNTGDDSAYLASPGSNQQSNLTSPGESLNLSPAGGEACAAQGEAKAPAAEHEAAEAPMLADEDITAEMLFADQPLEDVLEGKSPSQSTANVKAPAGVAQQAPAHDAPGSHNAQTPTPTPPTIGGARLGGPVARPYRRLRAAPRTQRPYTFLKALLEIYNRC